MNACVYVAIDRLPLGTVAAIEFVPVVALAALATRTGRNAAALVLAVAGVYLLTDVQLVAEPVGIAFAAANALLFAAYIVLGHRVSRCDDLTGSPGLTGIDGLALSMMVAAVVGVVVLAQVPSAHEVVGVALVVAGVALHREAPASGAG